MGFNRRFRDKGKFMNIEYAEFDLDQIIKTFSKELVCTKDSGEEIIKSDWFVDLSRNKVIFKLYIDKKED
jgi:hypothetical protein